MGDCTKEMLGIDTSKKGFRNKLTIIEASAVYNVHGGASCFQCKGNCAMNARCTGKKLGHLCVSKCHKGWGSKITYATICLQMRCVRSVAEELHDEQGKWV